MATVDEVKKDTREMLGLEDEDALDHVTEDLIKEYEERFAEADSERISVIREDGTAASEDDIAEIGAESTATHYGNRYMRLGTCFYWMTNGVGQPCGSGFSARACNWRSASAAWIQTCPGGFGGYRFTFTY
jgi:hypothetical protein